MWRTVDKTLDGYTFFIAGGDVFEEDGRKFKDPYTIICRDSLGDLFAYGKWSTLQQVLKWIENPHSLY